MKQKCLILWLLLTALLLASCQRVRQTGQLPDGTVPPEPPADSEPISDRVSTIDREATAESAPAGDSDAPIIPDSKEEPVLQTTFYIHANGTVFAATFAENSSAEAFRELLRKGDLTVQMSDYGSFEKVGSIGQSLPQNNTYITTEPGDVILYLGNQITVYYDINSWNFTRLGKIENATKAGLLAAFGYGDVTVTFSLTESE